MPSSDDDRFVHLAASRHLYRKMFLEHFFRANAEAEASEDGDENHWNRLWRRTMDLLNKVYNSVSSHSSTPAPFLTDNGAGSIKVRVESLVLVR